MESVNEIECALNELRTYIELLESIKTVIGNNPGLEVDTGDIITCVSDFSGSVTDLMYKVQQETGFKVKISVTT